MLAAKEYATALIKRELKATGGKGGEGRKLFPPLLSPPSKRFCLGDP
jgi:hypothetical protein